MYKYRHLIKNTFDRIKQYRSISKRYDKLESNYACMLLLAFILMWLPMYYWLIYEHKRSTDPNSEIAKLKQLVWKIIYDKALKLKIGQLQTIKDFNLSSSAVKWKQNSLSRNGHFTSFYF